jgi:hypothetical protein
MAVEVAGNIGFNRNGDERGLITSALKPTLRVITFNVESTPNGAAIFVNGENTGYTTPYSLQYTEAELLNGGRVVTLINGSVNSVETYILSAQILSEQITIEEPTNSSGGVVGGGGGRNSDFGDRNLGEGAIDRDNRELQAF